MPQGERLPEAWKAELGPDWAQVWHTWRHIGEGTSASDTSGGAGLAAPVPGHVSFSNLGESSLWPGHRLCFESASTGQAEPSPVFVSVGFRLRGWGILQCRFAGRRTRSIVPLRLHLRGCAR